VGASRKSTLFLRLLGIFEIRFCPACAFRNGVGELEHLACDSHRSCPSRNLSEPWTCRPPDASPRPGMRRQAEYCHLTLPSVGRRGRLFWTSLLSSRSLARPRCAAIASSAAHPPHRIRTDCTAAVAAGHRPRTVGRSVRSMARGTASTCSAMGSALRSPLGQRAEARPERSTSVPTGIHLYVLLRASLHFPFFQYMYVPQLPAGLAFV
jgi:hypothetical protein